MIKIVEKLIDIDENDINYIYSSINQFLYNVLNNGFNKDFINFLRSNKDTYKLQEITSNKLRSQECKLVHKDNPIKIVIGVSSKNSNYNSNENLICVYLNKSLFQAIVRVRLFHDINIYKPFDVNEFLNLLSSKEYYAYNKKIQNEFSKDSIKGMIYHELSHWIDDTKHNRHILTFINNINKAEDKEEYLLKKYGSIFPERSYMEINAQIHEIYELYREHKSMWNGINIFELISLSTQLIKIYEILKANTEDLLLWFRLLVTRMNREGILGSNMNYIPNSERYIYEWRQTDYNLKENYNFLLL